MTLSELKMRVDDAIERANEIGDDPTTIPVTLQIERGDANTVCAHEEMELHYDGGAQATGAVLVAWMTEDPD